MNAFPVPPPLLVIVSVAIERWHPHDESTRFRRWMKRVSGKRYSTHCPHVIAAGAPSNENVLEKQVGEIAAFHVRTRFYSPSLVAVIFQQILVEMSFNELAGRANASGVDSVRENCRRIVEQIIKTNELRLRTKLRRSPRISIWLQCFSHLKPSSQHCCQC